MSLAPIALFVYNRPVHTRQTIEALLKNVLAEESDLFIFSDSPKTPEAEAVVGLVRQYIHSITGFKSVKIIERERNFGLATSIIDGISMLCKKHGRVIVLEDDLITSPFFLRFMNESLDLYENEDKVMHISGSVYPVGSIEYETFFLRVPLCWGWATWGRAWKYFNKSNDVMLKFTPNMRSAFSFNDSFHYWLQLEQNKLGIIDTWFVYWYATLFLRNGMALFPGKTLVKNIGMDGTGEHSGVTDIYNVATATDRIRLNLVTPMIEESKEVVELHEIFFRKHYRPKVRPSLTQRVIAIIARLLPNTFKIKLKTLLGKM